MLRSLIGPCLALLALASPVFAILPPAYTDAPLRAVQFVDKNQGVAVGDHGVVWMTLDGGKTWDQMKSGTKASLRSVFFLDPFHGWAVGRTELADAAGSTGVVMHSADGGLTWTETSAGNLPGLNVVKFFDEKMGIAAGDGTAANPSGLYASDDGGKTWVPLPGSRTTSWTCAHFANMSNGVLAGVNSQLNSYTRGAQSPATVDLSGGRCVRGVSFDQNLGVAVGDGGTILCTTTGTKWTPADTGLSPAVADCLDFHCVARVGKTVWAAGRPGSVVLKSTDAGISWTICKTGWNLPLHAICAVSESEVWAVGELGTILHSTDGGAKWTVQRCGGQKAAVLFAHASSRNVPMDTVAAVGGRDGHLAVGYAVSAGDGKDGFRLAAAMRTAGGAGGECGRAFAVPAHLGDCSAADLVAEWNKQHDGKASDILLRRLVLAMRIWSPEVVVSEVLDNSASPVEQLVLTTVQAAFKAAEDPTICPEQIEVLGLKACGPKKLYAMAGGTQAAPHPRSASPSLPSPQRGEGETQPPSPLPAGERSPRSTIVAGEGSSTPSLTLDTTLFAKNLFNTVQAHAEPACSLLGAGVCPPSARHFKLVSHRLPGAERHAEMMQGLDLAEGGSARRKLPSFDPSIDEYLKANKVESMLDTRRTLDGLIQSAGNTIGLEKAMAMAVDLLKKMPDDVACRTAVALGRQFAAQGQWVAAREMCLIAAARYENFPETAGAVRWLNRYYASAEARMRADKASLVVMQYGGPSGGVSGVVQTSASESIKYSDGEAMQAWCRACLEMEGKMKAFGPAYTRDPATKLSGYAARRQLGLGVDATNGVKESLALTAGAKEMKPGQDLWRDCLAAELWLADPAAMPTQPKPLAVCPKVANKPFLDGKLGDECWQQLKPIEAKATAGETGGYATKAYFVHDDEYLYFAVECSHPDGKALPKAEARRRDDDLRGKDRVDILLDTDRDYQTYFRLQVDQRGCVAEDCWGDVSWNPKWFVAVEPTATGWTAEIAIPRSELTAGPFKSSAVWGMNVTRVVPGLGCQTWSGPAQATPRAEGVGLMQFMTEK